MEDTKIKCIDKTIDIDWSIDVLNLVKDFLDACKRCNKRYTSNNEEYELNDPLFMCQHQYLHDDGHWKLEPFLGFGQKFRYCNGILRKIPEEHTEEYAKESHLQKQLDWSKIAAKENTWFSQGYEHMNHMCTNPISWSNGKKMCIDRFSKGAVLNGTDFPWTTNTNGITIQENVAVTGFSVPGSDGYRYRQIVLKTTFSDLYIKQ